jgi:hypothetical protein
MHCPVILMQVMRRVHKDDVGLEFLNGPLYGGQNIQCLFVEAGIGEIQNLHLIQPQKLGSPLQMSTAPG